MSPAGIVACADGLADLYFLVDVAELFELLTRKEIGFHLDLLQCQDVGLVLSEESLDQAQPEPNRVDIPSGDSHEFLPCPHCMAPRCNAPISILFNALYVKKQDVNGKYFSIHSLKTNFCTLYPSCRATSPTKFNGRMGRGRCSVRPRRRIVMTHINRLVPIEHSELNSLVDNLFTGAILVLAGFLTFAQFVNI